MLMRRERRRMTQFPVRKFTVILRVTRMLGLVVTTHFAANAAAAALSIAVLDSIQATEPRTRPARAHAPTLVDASGLDDGRVASRAAAQKTILGRDPFCPSCEDVAEQLPPPGPPPAEVAPYGEDHTLGPLLRPGEPATALPLSLVATMEAVPPARSLATIRHAGGVGVFVRGDEILPEVELVKVGAGIVHLRNEASVEYLALEPPAPPRGPKKPKKPKKKPKKKSKKKNPFALAGAAEAIECPSKTHCTVERAFVEKLIARPALLAKQGRMLPYKKAGKMLGYRLVGARRGTVPALLKLRNGDVITAVNGQPLATLDAVLGMFPKLRHSSSLQLEITRKGKSRQLLLDIQ